MNDTSFLVPSESDCCLLARFVYFLVLIEVLLIGQVDEIYNLILLVRTLKA